MDWREDYARKQMSVEDAVKAVKSGDLVALPLSGPMSVPVALTARRHELRGITVRLTTPAINPGWFDENWLETFKMEFELFVGPVARHATDGRWASYVPGLFSNQFKQGDEREPLGTRPYDVAVVNLSPPNRAGYCNMGVHMWNKRSYIRRAKYVIAEVVPDLPIAHGNTWVHVSEIDCFIQGLPLRGRDIVTQLVELAKPERREEVERLLRGADQTSLMGIVTGERKQVHRGKATAVAWSGCDAEDLAFIDDNPLFELQEPEYLLQISMVSANNNVVAINNAISIDLTGQINAETIFGGRMFNGTGGQPENHIGAVISKGGRGITLLPSTAVGGAVSRIVAQFEPGTVVTIPRYFADIVVSEFGVAQLLGKSAKERAKELIAITHPNFRKDLQQQADALL